MYTLSIIFILASCSHLHAQNLESLFYPDEDGGLTSMDNSVRIPPHVNLTEIRGTSLYEKFVDRIISGGVTKLTLAINTILNSRRGSDNIVFAPVSIAGALALVLLGSNGKTFQEIGAVMGLATGVDVQRKSLQVHEQFGRMLNKLESSSGLSVGQQVNFAAAIFIQNNYPIRKVYKKTAEDLYQSEILNVDFESNPSEAQQVINNWVSGKTNGKIHNVLGEVPQPNTRVIITSAMYFKASWEFPFFEGTTAKRPFYPNGRKSPTNIQVELMANGGELPYFKDQSLNCEILGFPYKGNATTMYVVMPFNSDAQKLKELETRLTTNDLERLADSTVYREVVTLFPKMKLESTIELKPVLQRLGVHSLFEPTEANLAIMSPGEIVQSPPKIRLGATNQQNSSVNCSKIFNPKTNISSCRDVINDLNQTQEVSYKKIGDKIGRQVTNRLNTFSNRETIDNLRQLINEQSTDNNFQNPGLYADKVIHKVYMDITETGTEAAATTSISLSRGGGKVTFRVDVPFFFFIRNEETKTVLFWGSVVTPTPNFKKVQ
ncbi:hypothetical protein NQ317_010961 [Molorchus minor]|uniref:Serpin domain-containing protein n=1 Tax=Molorchus minor TaxID=1323400 RepID=A0ABQ9JXL8_9CUCU|nr:hypothetical protein NQ317_010961 [Molorchus minor]